MLSSITKLMLAAVFSLVLSSIALTNASAATPEFTITIKDHKFSPVDLKVPANTKVKLIIKNQDPTPEEFESHDLHREKVITGNGQGIVFIGPLKAGTYKYFGEFNQDTAQGTITAE